MKVGDVCRCIKDFQGEMEGELTIYKDDLFQVNLFSIQDFDLFDFLSFNTDF